VVGTTGAAPLAPTLNPTRAALDVAAAIAENPALVVEAELVTAPPAGIPAAVVTGDLAGFPRDAEDGRFAILSTGDATQAPTPNDSARAGVDAGGGTVRGVSDFDATVLRLDLLVPVDATCVTLEARFLSDEFPAFPGPAGNDALVAELGASTWTVAASAPVTKPGSTLSGTPLTVSASGLSSTEAAGTTYDGATQVVRASIPLLSAASPQSLFLSIYDEGDPFVDSAAMLDGLAFGTLDPATGECHPGDTVVVRTSTTTPLAPPGGTVDYEIELPGLPDAPGIASIEDVLPEGFAYVPGSTSGLTTDDPVVAGATLTWTVATPVAVSPDGTPRLHFRAVAGSGEFVFFNRADAIVSTTPFVIPSGPSAPLAVLTPPPPPPPLAADLDVLQTQTPAEVTVGQPVTYTIVVRNNGPGAASGVRLDFTPPTVITVKSVTATQGACAVGEKVSCDLGTLPAGGTATVVVAGRPAKAGAGTGTLVTSGAEADPNTANNAGGLETLVARVEPLRPELGESVTVEQVAGEVTATLPGDEDPVPVDELDEIPTGTRIDARKGKIELNAAVDAKGKVQSATFTGAEFVVTQKASEHGLTVLKLVGGNFDRCTTSAARSKPGKGRQLAKFVKRYGAPVLRGLWGEGKGNFRTRGRWSSATVRGTKWYTADSCDGTVVAVKRGVVEVRDLVKGKKVLVRAGESHFVKRRQPAVKRTVRPARAR
jgi:uncharacterized repeat protein (TIGR01451 family)